MLYMVIERFKPGAAPEIYRRLRDEGRQLVLPIIQELWRIGEAEALPPPA